MNSLGEELDANCAPLHTFQVGCQLLSWAICSVPNQDRSVFWIRIQGLRFKMLNKSLLLFYS